MTEKRQSDDAATLRAALAVLRGDKSGDAARPDDRAAHTAHLRLVGGSPEVAAEASAGRENAPPVRPRRPAARSASASGHASASGPASASGLGAASGPLSTYSQAAPATSAEPAETLGGGGIAGGRSGTERPETGGPSTGGAGTNGRGGAASGLAPLWPFIGATLAPVPLLLLAAAFGGLFSLAALMAMTAVVYLLDEVARRRGLQGPGAKVTALADRLSVLLAVLHFILLAVVIDALADPARLGPAASVATFLAFGLWFGQVSNSNAHELIHRSDRRLFRLGMWVFISLLFGHHTSAHRLVHHRFVATPDDPNTAAAGESFYAFAARAWPGAFAAGYAAEGRMRARRAAAGGKWTLHPYAVYLAGAAGFALLVLAAFGMEGLVVYLLLCAHAQLQLMLSDYVQHYGLVRRKLPSGALEPAGPQHSWDAPHVFSAAMMLNAPRHADHHSHPSRPYPELRFSPGGRAPVLPYSLPAMASIALVPRLWRRVMDRRMARAEMRARGG